MTVVTTSTIIGTTITVVMEVTEMAMITETTETIGIIIETIEIIVMIEIIMLVMTVKVGTITSISIPKERLITMKMKSLCKSPGNLMDLASLSEVEEVEAEEEHPE